MKNNNIGKLILFILLTITFCLALLGKDNLDSRRSRYIDNTKKITLYAGCDSGKETVTALFMNDFADRVRAKSNGKIDIETYSDSQIGGDLELLEACHAGSVSFVFQTTAPQVSMVPEAAIFDAPMAFKDTTDARNKIDEKILDGLKPYYRNKNLELLGIADQGFRQMTSNIKVEKMEDFKGIKIRTMENPHHILFWKSVGANPTPMSYSEVYIGLQQGVIDAQENPLEAIIVPKFYEQQDYLMVTNHVLHPVTCVASKKMMDNLPKEYQEIIEESISESVLWARNKTDNLLDKRMQTIIDSGTEVVYLEKDVLDEMKSSGKSVWSEVEDKLGNKVINLLR